MKKNRIFFTLGAISIIIFSLYFSVRLKSSKQAKQPYLTVVGPLLMADGLGRQAAELIDILKDDLTIGYKSSNDVATMEAAPPGILQILKNRKAPMGKVIVYEDFLGIEGLSFKDSIKGIKNPENIRIAYSMFESSLIPPEWVVALNHYFDVVAVPDQFLVDSYKNSGVTIPIFVLPLGLNLEQWLNAPLKKEKKSPMIFANLSAALPRKNQLKLIEAFYQAFGNSQDVRLQLNSRSGEEQTIEDIKNKIRHLGTTNITFTEMRMDKDLYFKIFQNVDCYVSLSSGEGFSIQPREAMALGIPVVITDNTGQSTICRSTLGRTVPSRNLIPAFYPGLKNYYGLFQDCTTEDAAQALQDVYNNYDYYLQQGPAARSWVKQGSYDQLKPLYLGLIKPKKIVLGAINKITPDCLFTDSEELCEKFHRLVGIPFEDQR